MDNGLNENEQMTLSSTYGILTAERIFARCDIHLTHDSLSSVMRNPRSVYFQILLVPFKNIINGIILQQAYDYQIYVQKIFVDYLISGRGNESEEGEEKPGANIRDDLEENRLKLIAEAERFDKHTFTHKILIHQTQAHLTKQVALLNSLQDTEENADIIAQTMSAFLEQAVDLAEVLRQSRMAFKRLIIDTLRLIPLLPDYRGDEAHDAEKLSELEFDDQLGM